MNEKNLDRKTARAALPIRPRRNRKSKNIRQMLAETVLSPHDFVLPLFVKAGTKVKEPISALPGHSRLSPDLAVALCREAANLGISGVALFPVIEDRLKDPTAKESYNANGLVPQVIAKIKDAVPDLIVVSDVAMDPYSSDGHDGLVKDGKILNDETLEILAKMACVQAKAGADFIGPSDMMDGRVGYLRQALDEDGFSEVGILSYAAKYASAFYGPFRAALDSAPRSGDKKTYQMNPANRREALREAELDVRQGADVIMIKPALSYLDVIAQVKARIHLPIAAYNVSGEYAMIKAAAAQGWLEEKPAALESLLSIKRAGADCIFTYWAVSAAQWLNG